MDEWFSRIAPLALGATLAASVAIAQAPSWTDGIQAAYRGEAWSAGTITTVVTEFAKPGANGGTSGGLEGSYRFLEAPDRWVEGSLVACRPEGDLTLRCQWRDRFGQGVAQFVFTPRLRSFTGSWSRDDGPGHPWTGTATPP